jgi:hypothetical protein
LDATKVEIMYAVDQAHQNPRSGNVVAVYKIIFYFSAKNKAGQAITLVRDGIMGTVLIHDGKLEKFDF